MWSAVAQSSIKEKGKTIGDGLAAGKELVTQSVDVMRSRLPDFSSFFSKDGQLLVPERVVETADHLVKGLDVTTGVAKELFNHITAETVLSGLGSGAAIVGVGVGGSAGATVAAVGAGLAATGLFYQQDQQVQSQEQPVSVRSSSAVSPRYLVSGTVITAEQRMKQDELSLLEAGLWRHQREEEQKQRQAAVKKEGEQRKKELQSKQEKNILADLMLAQQQQQQQQAEEALGKEQAKPKQQDTAPKTAARSFSQELDPYAVVPSTEDGWYLLETLNSDSDSDSGSRSSINETNYDARVKKVLANDDSSDEEEGSDSENSEQKATQSQPGVTAFQIRSRILVSDQNDIKLPQEKKEQALSPTFFHMTCCFIGDLAITGAVVFVVLMAGAASGVAIIAGVISMTTIGFFALKQMGVIGNQRDAVRLAQSSLAPV